MLTQFAMSCASQPASHLGSTWEARAWHVCSTWVRHCQHVGRTWVARGWHVGDTWVAREHVPEDSDKLLTSQTKDREI